MSKYIKLDDLWECAQDKGGAVTPNDMLKLPCEDLGDLGEERVRHFVQCVRHVLTMLEKKRSVGQLYSPEGVYIELMKNLPLLLEELDK